MVAEGLEIILFGVVLGVIVVIYSARERKPKPLMSKKQEEAQKKLDEIKTLAAIPEDAPPPPTTLSGDSPPQPLEQLPIPKKIAIELTRLKGDRRVTTKRGVATLVPRSNKDIFFVFIGKMGYFIDPAKIVKVKDTGRRGKSVITEKLVYDQFNSEALDQEGKLSFSWTLEELLADSGMEQYINVATFEGSFQLTPALMRALMFVGFLGFLMGLSINGSAHVVPTTIIHWIP
jgi:hypothetical protein